MFLLLEEKPNVFKHDETPPHIEGELKTSWNRLLTEWSFGQGKGSTAWPTPSSDLTPLDFL
jgi:hypothetical protein